MEPRTMGVAAISQAAAQTVSHAVQSSVIQFYRDEPYRPSMLNILMLNHPPRSSPKTYEAVIARLLAAPRCLEFSFLVRPVSSAFVTASSLSVRINSTWHGLLMYGLIRPWAR